MAELNRLNMKGSLDDFTYRMVTLMRANEWHGIVVMGYFYDKEGRPMVQSNFTAMDEDMVLSVIDTARKQIAKVLPTSTKPVYRA